MRLTKDEIVFLDNKMKGVNFIDRLKRLTRLNKTISTNSKVIEMRKPKLTLQEELERDLRGRAI